MSFEARSILSVSATLFALVLTGCTRQEMTRGVTPCPGGDAPKAVVCGFYDQVLELPPLGLPSREEQAVLAPYLTLELLRLMDEARTYQEAFEREHPGDKPPFVDGSLFTSLFEGFDRFEVLRAEELGSKEANVVVRFGYQDADPWEDAVHVTYVEGRTAIADIFFSGAGTFNPGGRLSERLAWRE